MTQRSSAPRPKILIVEDDEQFQRLLRRFLEPEYDVATAGDGQEALKRIATDRPAVVLTDVVMPVMNGVELLRKIRGHPDTRELPVIVLLATASPEDVRVLRELAAFNILAKEEISRAALREKVAEQLRKDPAVGGR